MAVLIPGWVNNFRNVIKDMGFLALACEGNDPGTEVSGQRGRRVVLPAMELAPLDSSLYPRRLETLCGTPSGVLETAQQVA